MFRLHPRQRRIKLHRTKLGAADRLDGGGAESRQKKRVHMLWREAQLVWVKRDQETRLASVF